MIGKDQSNLNLNRSQHSSSSVKAVSRGAAIRLLLSHLSLDIYGSLEREIRLREQPDGALHVLYRPHSIFLPNESISFLIWKTGLTFGSKGMVLSMSPNWAPSLVRLASERFFRAGTRPGPTRGHPPQRKQHCSPLPEKQKIRESRLKIHA